LDRESFEIASERVAEKRGVLKNSFGNRLEIICDRRRSSPLSRPL
jgi:hypothetical protein